MKVIHYSGVVTPSPMIIRIWSCDTQSHHYTYLELGKPTPSLYLREVETPSPIIIRTWSWDTKPLSLYLRGVGTTNPVIIPTWSWDTQPHHYTYVEFGHPAPSLYLHGVGTLSPHYNTYVELWHLAPIITPTWSCDTQPPSLYLRGVQTPRPIIIPMWSWDTQPHLFRPMVSCDTQPHLMQPMWSWDTQPPLCSPLLPTVVEVSAWLIIHSPLPRNLWHLEVGSTWPLFFATSHWKPDSAKLGHHWTRLCEGHHWSNYTHIVMNQTVWMASLVTLHAHSHEPDSVKGVTGNTTHTVMNQTVWRASLVKLHAHSHEPDSVMGVTGNTTHTFMNGSDSLFIKEVGHLKAMQSPPPPTTHKHIATNTVTCTLSLTWSHPHTVLKYLLHTYG